MSASPLIAVVGSLNMDLVVRVERHPVPGETLLGSSYAEHPGGKGANQAVAAARSGARVRMIGRVGSDAFGEALAGSLERDGVGLEHLARADARTGVALIQVDAAGQNTIVVAPGANATLRPDDLHPAMFEGARALLLQLEIPLETVRAAARLARRAGAEVVLNAAPAQDVGEDGLGDVGTLLVNEGEAAALLGGAEGEVRADPAAAAAALGKRVPRVVVTLGARGAAWADASGGGVVPAFAVEAVDTTAAGDAFAGTLAHRLVLGDPLEGAVRWACAAGALAATRSGAQPSLPRSSEVARLLAGEG